MSVRWFPVAGEQDAVTERRASTDQVIPVAGGGLRRQGGRELFLVLGSRLGPGACEASPPRLCGAPCSLPLPLLGRCLSEKTAGGGVEVSY